MSNHIANRQTRWSRKVVMKPRKFYDVKDVTAPDGYPYFSQVMRDFSSSRLLSRHEYDAFIEAIDRDCFYEMTHSCRPHDSEFGNWPLTIRRARRIFWELLACEGRKESAMAKKLIGTCFDFLESCRRYDKDRQDVIDATFDAMVLFTLDRYLLDDCGSKFFSPRMFKLLFAKASEASEEVLEVVCVAVLEHKLKNFKHLLSLAHYCSIREDEWEGTSQIFIALVEGIGKDRLSTKVKGLIGQLLVVLAQSRLDHSNFSYRYDQGRKIAMDAYRASVKSVLSDVRRWLDGKELEFRF